MRSLATSRWATPTDYSVMLRPLWDGLSTPGPASHLRHAACCCRGRMVGLTALDDHWTSEIVERSDEDYHAAIKDTEASVVA
ncbi:MAG: hypothetical protein ACRDRT_03105 [Pseudonocardiaceae bacterium]